MARLESCSMKSRIWLLLLSRQSVSNFNHPSLDVIHVTHQKTVVVRDQPLRVEAPNPNLVYGPVMVQKMGMHTREEVRDRTQLNGTCSYRRKSPGYPMLTLLRSGFLRLVRHVEVL
jgi:hypothetical protein